MALKLTGAVCAVAVMWAQAASAATVKVPEGTEFPIRIEEALSSKTSAEGDRFTISLADDVKLPDGTTIPQGYRGVGEVVAAKKNGRMGKGGELNVRLDYIRVGETRVKLRGNRGRTGDDKTGSTVVLTVLFGPLGLLKKGKNVEIPKGQQITAYVDSDFELTTPLVAAPVS